MSPVRGSGTFRERARRGSRPRWNARRPARFGNLPWRARLRRAAAALAQPLTRTLEERTFLVGETVPTGVVELLKQFIHATGVGVRGRNGARRAARPQPRSRLALPAQPGHPL